MKDFLLNVSKIGIENQNQFMNECSQNPDRFENEVIKRTKLQTFSSDGARRTVRINGKVKEVKMERDLFGKILCLALQRKIDTKVVL